MAIRINKQSLNLPKKHKEEEDETMIKEKEEHGCSCCSPDSECILNEDWVED